MRSSRLTLNTKVNYYPLWYLITPEAQALLRSMLPDDWKPPPYPHHNGFTPAYNEDYEALMKEPPRSHRLRED